MTTEESVPGILAIGNGWSPDQLGGLNRYFTNLHLALLRKHDQVHGIVLGPASNPPRGLLVAADRSLPLPLRLTRTFNASRLVVDRSDVIVGHFALNLALPILLGKGRTKPVAIHFHGPWSAEAQAMGQASVKTRAKFKFEQIVYRRADVLIVLSSTFRQVLIDDYGIAEERISVIPPGVDLARFNPAHRSHAKPSEYAFAVRRLVPRMGLEHLIRAWAKVDRRIHLYIAGDGPLRSSLQDLIDSLGLESDVTLLGHISDAELSRLYAGALFSVVPTLELEGFGLVVLESLASGTPVIASGIEGLREVLGEFSPGLLVPPGDVTALTDLINHVLRDRSLLPTPATCRQEAERYSWNNTASRALQEYSRALELRATRPITRQGRFQACRTLAGKRRSHQC